MKNDENQRDFSEKEECMSSQTNRNKSALHFKKEDKEWNEKTNSAEDSLQKPNV